MSFTLKILCAGQVHLTEPAMTFDRWRRLAPTVEPMIPGIEARPVAIVAIPDDDHDNVIHILGRWN